MWSDTDPVASKVQANPGLLTFPLETRQEITGLCIQVTFPGPRAGLGHCLRAILRLPAVRAPVPCDQTRPFLFRVGFWF